MKPKFLQNLSYKKLNAASLCFSILLLFLLAGPGQTSASDKKTMDKEAVQKKAGTKDTEKIRRPTHKHRSFSERVEERKRMVKYQIHDRDISDPNVLRALSTVPRHALVRKSELRQAYSDRPLPIGYGQTISQPYIVAYMTEKLNLDPNSRVLEIGTGSGYQAAVCAEIAKEVYTIEIVEPLAKTATEKLKELGYRNVFTKAADGYTGWPMKAPFDAVIITAAAGLVPPPLVEQLKPGGRMILPLGSPYGVQTLVLVTKDKDKKVSSKRLLPVRFVPMLGKIEQVKR